MTANFLLKAFKWFVQVFLQNLNNKCVDLRMYFLISFLRFDTKANKLQLIQNI